MAYSLEDRETDVYDEFFATKEDDEYIINATNLRLKSIKNNKEAIPDVR